MAQVPDPRDPRGVRYTPAVVLTLTACAVLAGATSLRAGTRTRTRTRHFAALRPASLEHQLGGAK
ncbi:transposase family protein [Kitasatospora sp. NPDC086801]|uniref:transposase family protein n=1 Tax=Kitasatospora sp. NPDC086801 TaxID=3364066 RepID=UPI00381A68F4